MRERIVYVQVKTKDERLALLFNAPGIAYSVAEVLERTGIRTKNGLKTASWRLRPGIDLHIVKGEDIMVRES